MIDRPYVLLSCAISVDGYLDDAGPGRLLLSNEADFDRVDEVRAGCDAIMVGANTVRRDDPRLLIRDQGRRAARRAAGLPEHPTKITLTASGRLDPGSRFFTTGPAARLVYAPATVVAALRADLAGQAEVVDTGPAVALPPVLADLADRGVRRLLVEGGGTVLTALLAAGLADELHLVIAPVLVGDPGAPRFLHAGRFRWTSEHPMCLADVRRIGEVVLLRYLLDRDRDREKP